LTVNQWLFETAHSRSSTAHHDHFDIASPVTFPQNHHLNGKANSGSPVNPSGEVSGLKALLFTCIDAEIWTGGVANGIEFVSTYRYKVVG